MKTYTYLNNEINRPGDLAPKGVRSTYKKEMIGFNETFERLWQLINTLN